jgi:chemosensory pili system protein ChpA (sensor histidine kinase/response regulator)
MDDTFTIDDAGPAFPSDARRALSGMGQALATVAADPVAPAADAALTRLADAGHGLRGSSLLVSARGLAIGAEVAQELAAAGREARRQFAAARARLEAVSSAGGGLIAAMHEVLGLELDRKGPAAELRAQQAAAKVRAVLDAPVGDGGAAATPAAVVALNGTSKRPDINPGWDFAEETEPAIVVPGMSGEAVAPSPTANADDFAFVDEAPAAGTFPASDPALQAIFAEEASESLPGLQAALLGLARGGDAGAPATLARIFHTWKGSSAVVGLMAVSNQAKTLERQAAALTPGDAAGVAMLAEAADLLLAGLGLPTTLAEAVLPLLPTTATAAPAEAPATDAYAHDSAPETSALMAATPPTPTSAAPADEADDVFGDITTEVGDNAAAVTAAAADNAFADAVTADASASAPMAPAAVAPEPEPEPAAPVVPTAAALVPAVWEAFATEAADILDGIAAGAADLAGAAAVDSAGAATLLRHCHTLKGAANTVGLIGVGRLLHALEDWLEAAAVAAPPPAGAVAAAVLLPTHAALAAALTRGPRAAIAYDPADLLPKLINARMALPAPATVTARPAPAPDASEAIHDPAAATMRVATKHLDRLMNLAGELLVSRARLGARVGSITSLQRELAATRRRLVGTVDGFRERNEFRGLDGEKPAHSRTTPGAFGKEAAFTDLELDQYEDVHILSRSLAELGNDVGELQSQIQNALAGFGDDAEGLSRLVGGIQGEITRARMVPLGQLAVRLRLAVLDAATRENREVHVVTAGEDVVLDKALVDAIHMPLLHLVRNAVAHGIESGDERVMLGKPTLGRITIEARHLAGQVVITVADDGRGLDLERLRAKGAAAGLVAADAPLESEAVMAMVFAAGISTRDSAGSVGGRGVGGNIVREEVQRLGGTIVVATTPGAGTTFTITLPLTLAISRALLVACGPLRLAVPMNLVERLIMLEEHPTPGGAGHRRIAYDGTTLPVGDLRVVLGMAAGKPGTGPALIVRLGLRRLALAVDRVVAQEEIVFGGLGDLLAGHPLFAGVTTDGEGNLIPIVDLPGVATEIEATMPAAPAARQAQKRLVVPAAATHVASTGAPAPATPAPAQRAVRVLVVDDSLSVRKVASALLAGIGVEVVLAVDGEDALAQLRKQTIDLVFTDLEMPRMHGYDLIREIRFIPAFSRLPVVVVTSRSGDKHRAQATAVGANAYLTKPFTVEAMSSLVHRLVGDTATTTDAVPAGAP